MEAMPNRIVISNKDVMNITGKSSRTACRILAKIRKHYDKPPKGYVCIFEFCEVTMIRETFVLKFIR